MVNISKWLNSGILLSLLYEVMFLLAAKYGVSLQPSIAYTLAFKFICGYVALSISIELVTQDRRTLV